MHGISVLEGKDQESHPKKGISVTLGPWTMEHHKGHHKQAEKTVRQSNIAKNRMSLQDR